MFHNLMTVAVLVVGGGLLSVADVQGQEQENVSQPRSEENADRLRQVVQSAARNHQAFCNQFLIAAVSEYLKDGETFSNEGKLKNVYSDLDFGDMNADHQIDYMATHWTRVDLHRAMQLANEGKFVVAGMKSRPGLRNPPDYDQHGHVGVVMPGGPHPQTRWPIVAGGGSAAARSVEGKAMNYVWNPYFLHPRLMVEFFTPRFTPQTVTVDVRMIIGEKPKVETKGFAYNKDAPKKVGSLAGTKWTKPNGDVIEFSKDTMDKEMLRHFGPEFSNTAAANQKLFGLPQSWRVFSDRIVWDGLYHQVENKLYTYDEFVTGSLIYVKTGTIYEDKIVIDPRTWDDGSVSEGYTLIKKKQRNL